MSTALSLAGAGVAVLAAALAISGRSSPSPQPRGHLILQIEGDARALAITRITPKPDPCGPTDRIESSWEIVVSAADGAELGRYPLDLSKFDLDPALVGRGIVVEGCALRDTRVAALASIPRWPGAGALEIVRGHERLGRIEGAALQALIEEGERR